MTVLSEGGNRLGSRFQVSISAGISFGSLTKFIYQSYKFCCEDLINWNIVTPFRHIFRVFDRKMKGYPPAYHLVIAPTINLPVRILAMFFPTVEIFWSQAACCPVSLKKYYKPLSGRWAINGLELLGDPQDPVLAGQENYDCKQRKQENVERNSC